jgi:hypothetical protein
MILLVTPSGRGSQCAATIRAATGQEVLIAESLVRATTLLRTGSYLLVVLDKYLPENDADAETIMCGQLDNALLVEVNLAVTGMDRLVREVRAALERRQREEASARQSAVGQLQGELSGTLTALLLSVELALKTPSLPAPLTEKLEVMHELINVLCGKVREARSQRELDMAMQNQSDAECGKVSLKTDN